MRAVGIHVDIDERKQFENRISENAAFLNIVFEAITQPFAVINTHDFSIAMANSSYGGIEAIGKTCYSVSGCPEKPCQGPFDPCPLPKVKATENRFQ